MLYEIIVAIVYVITLFAYFYQLIIIKNLCNELKAECIRDGLQNTHTLLLTLKYNIQDLKYEQVKTQAMLEAINSHQQVAEEKLDKLSGDSNLVTKIRKKREKNNV